jgi:mycoredoxin
VDQRISESGGAAESAAADQLDRELIVYGTTWCPDCHRTRRFLDTNGVPYHWIDADDHPEVNSILRRVNNGRRAVPTLIFPDGSTMVEPSDRALAEKLGIVSLVR